jgi:hypothetical protein
MSKEIELGSFQDYIKCVLFLEHVRKNNYRGGNYKK